MTYMIYLGVSVAATVRVGLAVGSGHAEKASIATKVSDHRTFTVGAVSELLKVGLGAEVAISVIAAAIFLVLRSHLGSIFVKDEAIIDAVTGASGAVL